MEVKIIIGDDGSLSVDVPKGLQTVVLIGILECAKDLIFNQDRSKPDVQTPTQEVPVAGMEIGE